MRVYGKKNTNNVFIGFSGEEFNNLPECSKNYLLEYVNLKKISYKRFISKVKSKVPPANENVAQTSYAVGNRTRKHLGISEEEYETLSGGIFFLIIMILISIILHLLFIYIRVSI
jgi:hypothetical protein